MGCRWTEFIGIQIQTWYHLGMYNWDYQDNEDIKKDPVWHLERLLNYGLNGEKINREILEKNFDQLRIPEDTRAFLELLLWNKPF